MPIPTFPLDVKTDPWAAYFHAIGVLSVAWNALERLVETAVAQMLRIDDDTSSLIVANLGNGTLPEAAARLARNVDRRPDLIDCVDHLVKGFDVCRQNRNIVVHSELGFNAMANKARLFKRSRLGALTAFPAELKEIQKVAESITAFANFAAEIVHIISVHPDTIVGGPDPNDPDWPPPWPDKPALPSTLIPLLPAGVQKGSPAPR
jgi:hypothetical protein